jgi:hypothetical protein
MLFEFFTLSRSLTLGVTCAILAMAVWRRGNLAWLFIAFLPLCDFMFGVISAALVYLRWRERKAPFSLIGLWLCAGLVSASTVRPASDIVPALILHSPLMDLAIWMSNLSTVGLPLQWSGLAPVWNNPPPLPVAGLALCAFLFVCFTETRTRRDDALVLWGIMAVTLVFSIAVYPLAARHLMLIGLILILLIWHRIDTWGPQPGQAFRAWLLAAAACGLSTAVISCVKPFDTAAQAAAEIRHHGLEGKNWMAFPDSSGQGVAAINGMLFERTDDRCVQDFVRWNHKSSPAIWKGDGLYREFARKVREDGRFYLLSDFILTEQPPLLRRLSIISAGYDGQKFALYVVGEDHPDSTTLHRRCNGPALPFPRP